MLTVEGEPADAIKAANYIKERVKTDVKVEVYPRSKNADVHIVTVRNDSTAISFYDVEEYRTDICITNYNYLIVTTCGHQSAMYI